jgi:hypothetical protein
LEHTQPHLQLQHPLLWRLQRSRQAVVRRGLRRCFDVPARVPLSAIDLQLNNYPVRFQQTPPRPLHLPPPLPPLLCPLWPCVSG